MHVHFFDRNFPLVNALFGKGFCYCHNINKDAEADDAVKSEKRRSQLAKNLCSLLDLWQATHQT